MSGIAPTTHGSYELGPRYEALPALKEAAEKKQSKKVKGLLQRAITACSLAAGDAEYHAKYTFARRTKLFVGVLEAMQYAHAQGLVHPAVALQPHAEAHADLIDLDLAAARIRTAVDPGFALASDRHAEAYFGSPASMLDEFDLDLGAGDSGGERRGLGLGRGGEEGGEEGRREAVSQHVRPWCKVFANPSCER